MIPTDAGAVYDDVHREAMRDYSGIARQLRADAKPDRADCEWLGGPDDRRR